MKLDKVKYLKRVIAISWLALLACFIIKIFGGNFFVIMCENERVVAICKYADNHLWAKFIIGFVYALPSCYFYTLALCQRPKFKNWQLVIVVITVLLSTFVKLFSKYVGLIIDLWQLIFMPFVFLFKDKKKLLNIPLGFVLILVFQVISMITKNVKLEVMGDNMLIGAIFSIDVILMVLLYYAYSNLILQKGEI